MKAFEKEKIFITTSRESRKWTDTIKLASIKEFNEIFKNIVSSYDSIRNNDFKKFWEYLTKYPGRNKFFAFQSHVCCPNCKHFSPRYKYVEPKTSYDELAKKYRKLIIADLIFKKYVNEECYYYSIDVNTLHDTILDLVYDETADNKDFCRRPLDFGFNYDSKYLEEFIPIDEFKHDENGIIFTCPKCGAVLKTSKTANLSRDIIASNIADVKYLIRNINWKAENEVLYNYNIFEEKDNPKVTLSLIYHHYFPNIHGQLHVETSNDRVVFNTKTGKTYIFRRIDLKTKKPWHVDERRIINSTYGNYYKEIKLPRKIAQDVTNVICKKNNVPLINIPDIEATKYYNTRILSVVNRYCFLGESFVLTFYNANAIRNFPNKEKLYYYQMKDNKELFNDKAKEYGLKGQRKKNFAKNPMCFCYDGIFQLWGFENNDVINTLYSNLDILANFLQNNETRTNQICSFVKDYLALKPEAELCQKLLKDNEIVYFRDLCNMYYRIKANIVITDDLKKNLFKGSLKEIHDRLSIINDKIAKQHFYIPYTKEELELNCVIDDYYFEVAKTSLDMKEVGQKMHICVGSYDWKAYKKICVIVFMRDRFTQEPAVCIELSPDGKKLRQAKDYCNDYVKPEKRKALKTFLEENKIDYKCCYDAIGTNFFDDKKSKNYQRNESQEGYSVFDNQRDFTRVFLKPEKLFGYDIEFIETEENPNNQFFHEFNEL